MQMERLKKDRLSKKGTINKRIKEPDAGFALPTQNKTVCE
jgi:hypothetical protein